VARAEGRQPGWPAPLHAGVVFGLDGVVIGRDGADRRPPLRTGAMVFSFESSRSKPRALPAEALYDCRLSTSLPGLGTVRQARVQGQRSDNLRQRREPLQRGMLKLHPGGAQRGEVKAVRQRLERGAGIWWWVCCIGVAFG